METAASPILITSGRLMKVEGVMGLVKPEMKKMGMGPPFSKGLAILGIAPVLKGAAGYPRRPTETAVLTMPQASIRLRAPQ